MENNQTPTVSQTAVVKGTPKDVFLHLLSAATLYFSVVSFIMLWWQYINFLFPDKLNYPGYGSYIYEPILWSTSALVVAFPVYILISWLIGRDFRSNPEKREARVRKWLWYLTLFIAAVTIIIDLITLIFNFLKGDLTTQFFLKILVILAVTVAVFVYYLWDLKKRETASNKPKLMAWITGGIILLSVIYGFVLVGSPATRRNMRFDERRISDLQTIQSSVVGYWQQKDRLPETLDELNGVGYMVAKDPETDRPYEYSATGDLSFRLCAEFKTEEAPSDNRQESLRYAYKQVGIETEPRDWTHPRGRACFDNTIDRDFHKPNGNILPAVPTY